MRIITIVCTFAFHLLFLRGKTRGERLVLTLVRLGPVWTKGGQMLAALELELLRGVQSELEKLYGRMGEMPFSVVSDLVGADLGSLAPHLSNLEPKALGAASIAQVHPGLWDGEEVAVKVLRPGIARRVSQDVAILRKGIAFLSLFSKAVRSLRSARIPEHILDWIEQETDFLFEAQNLRELGAQCEGTPLVIPQVKFASKSLLVMTRLRGPTIGQWDESWREQGYNPQASVMNFLRGMFVPLFAQERPILFHGDPHPDNLIILPGGRIGLVDAGLLGRVTEEQLREINDVIFAVYEGDVERVVAGELRLCKYRFARQADHDRFATDIASFVQAAKRSDFTYWLMGMAHVLVRHGVPSPEVFVLAARFGILANRSVQTFFRGASVPELLGDEMEAGIIRREIVGLVRWCVDKAKFLPTLARSVLNNPTSFLATIANAVALELRKA